MVAFGMTLGLLSGLVFFIKQTIINQENHHYLYTNHYVQF